MATICTSCGAAVPDGVKFCTACGAAAPAAQPAPQPAPAYQPAPVPAPATPPAPQSDTAPAKGSIYAPIGAWGYIGYFILFAIPVLGLVLAIAWSRGKGNVNRRDLARAMLVFQLLAVIALVAGLVFGVAMQKTITSAVSEAIGQQVSGIGDIFSFFGGTGDGTIFTAQWPKNEFTQQVPKPDFEVSFGSVSDTEYTALFGNVSTNDLKKYVEKVKRAGFGKNAKTEEQAALGVAVYSYTADNGKGYQVSVATALGMNAIAIKKLG
jgi:hypothetical protein